MCPLHIACHLTISNLNFENVFVALSVSGVKGYNKLILILIYEEKQIKFTSGLIPYLHELRDDYTYNVTLT